MNINITLKELKEIAKEQGLKGYSNMSKEKLIAEIAKLELKEKTARKENVEFKNEETIEKGKNKKISKFGKRKKDKNEITQFNIEVIREDGVEYTLDAKEDFEVYGYLDVLPDGYGFLREEMFISSNNDIYVSPHQVKKYGLHIGDHIKGVAKRTAKDKFPALTLIIEINGILPELLANRKDFDTLTPIFPNSRFNLETESNKITSRIIDLIAPIGKGQRGVIVSPPKSGKTTIIKEIANSITKNTENKNTQLIILLIDERPEEVTDIAENVSAEVVSSTFDEQPQNHVRIAEMVLEKAKRNVESGKDVVILLDSITRLARAYNQVVPSSGKTLSGGFDPSALYKPKRFFGSARNLKEGGSLTIIATALVDTGSRMDDVIYEEFKGTGNMEIVLDRSLSENRIYPAIDVKKSGTRREDLLLNSEELETINSLRRFMARFNTTQAIEYIIHNMKETKTNADFLKKIKEEMKRIDNI